MDPFCLQIEISKLTCLLNISSLRQVCVCVCVLGEREGFAAYCSTGL